MEWKILLLAKGFQPESKSILFTDRLLFLKAATLPLYGPLRVRGSVSLDSLSRLDVNRLPE